MKNEECRMINKKSGNILSLNFEFLILNSRRGGFTLIELIISIAILSIITVIIGAAFRLGIQAWEKGEKETEDAQRLRVLSSLFSQQLKSLYPYKIKMEDKDEEVVVFKGESDSITFVTTLTDSSYGGFKWVKYIFSDGALLYREGLLPDKKIEEHINNKDKEEIIDTNIEDFQFSYLSPDDDEWKESWDFGEDVPVAIKVNISHFQPFVINIPAGLDREKDDEGSEPEKTQEDI
ncbi:MAG: prepilin-type N-terminal cleavage/methylation domain-containing protein [Nitrospirae bacterium]|nr:prepilin-type N-terminal cleavage/methylation domain-containing protein [Nitrospirota bacterium]